MCWLAPLAKASLSSYKLDFLPFANVTYLFAFPFSIILHPVMTVQTTVLTQMLNIQKVSTRKELVSTGIMTFHFLRYHLLF